MASIRRGLLLISLVGICAGLLTGFFADAAAAGGQFMPFEQWLGFSFQGGAPRSVSWGVGGMVVALAITQAIRFLGAGKDA